MKNNKARKDLQLEIINKMYDDFWMTYNSMPNDNFKIRDKFKNRIINKHYKNQTLSRLLIGIKWFISNYDLNTYYCTFVYLGNKVPYINIYRFNDDKKPLFEYTIIKNEVILVNDFIYNNNIKL